MEEAYKIYSKSVPAYEDIAKNHPKNVQYQLDLANAYGWLGSAAVKNKELEAATKYRKMQVAIYDKLISDDPDNTNLKYESLGPASALVSILRLSNRQGEALKAVRAGYKKSKDLYQSDPNNKQWAESLLYFLYEYLLVTIDLKNVEEAKLMASELTRIKKRVPIDSLREPEKLLNLHEAVTKRLEAEINKNPSSHIGDHYAPE
jgi:hypothetical protein